MYPIKTSPLPYLLWFAKFEKNKSSSEEILEIIRDKLLLDMGFSEKAVSILNQKLNMGTMKDPSITEQHQGSCGDILFLSLKIEGSIIHDAMYEYIGCAGLQSCASALSEMIKGRTLEEAARIEIEDIISFLEGIPEKKYECAEIARDTLRKIIHNWKNPTLKVL
jgi:NifU-like protein involved in Fe-S cluster formation